MKEQTLGSGETQYDVKYQFVNNYYEGEELVNLLKEKYPDAEFMLKDRAFLDFLNLPAKHNERQLQERKCMYDYRERCFRWLYEPYYGYAARRT